MTRYSVRYWPVLPLGTLKGVLGQGVSPALELSENRYSPSYRVIPADSNGFVQASPSLNRCNRVCSRPSRSFPRLRGVEWAA